jgi:ubiquinone/menaquinone biosynthesis C-methylase UbiE
MGSENNNRVCPVERAGGLDNRVRSWLQNPRKILNPYVKEGMTVLDLGCGPGFFSIEIARLLKGSGKVIAADLQQGMLDKLHQKIKGTAFVQRIVLHRCNSDSINLTEKADFVLAFYMVHEVPDQEKLFKELKEILNPDGRILIVEPNFHVSKTAFDEMLAKTKNAGFEILDRPKMFFSRTVVLGNNLKNHE